MPDAPLKLFYSYSHKDEAMRRRLEAHLSVLRRLGAIAAWHDRQIGGGAEWKREISEHMESADLILLLISSDFLASDYCWDIEMKRAIERHDQGDAVVIPIMLHPVDWEGAPFAKLQTLPRDALPVSQWRSEEEAFAEIAKGIRAVIEKQKERAAAFEPFRLELWTAQQDAGPATGAASPGTYAIGTRIVVHFRATRECYVTLLNVGTSGRLTVLFPNALHPDDHILPGRTYDIPGPGDGFEYEISGPAGTETLKAVATLEKVPLLDTQFAQDGSLFRTVSATAAARDIAIVQKRAATLDRANVAECECRFQVV